jgi:Zn-dependent protease with chaperone function
VSADRARVADTPLATLVVVGAAFVAGLTVLIASRSVAPNPFDDCATLAATLVARLTAVGLLTPAAVLAVVVLSGALALGHQAWATRRELRRVLVGRTTIPPHVAAAAAAAGLGGAVDVVADDAVYTFCYGLFRPRVCLSTALVRLLRPDELLAVLRHEAHHARHRDPAKILVARTVASALFFLPLAAALRNGFLAGKEICADADATAHDSALALPRALVKMLQAKRPIWPAGVLAIGALSPTEARIQHLLEPEAVRSTLPSAVDWIVSAALVAGIFGFSYGSAAAHAEGTIQTSCSTAPLAAAEQ